MMKKIFLIIFIFSSLYVNSQDVKILDDFVFLGMINENRISINKSNGLYEIERTSQFDSKEKLPIFLNYARKILKERNLIDDIIIDSTHEAKIYSKNITKILNQYYNYKEVPYKKLLYRIFQKERRYKRTPKEELIDNMDKLVSYLLGAFLRNGTRENNLITFKYMFDVCCGNGDESKPLFVFECLNYYCSYTNINYNKSMTDLCKGIDIFIDFDKTDLRYRTDLLNDIKYLK